EGMNLGRVYREQEAGPAGAGPASFGRYFSFRVGSPNRIQSLRTSESEVAAFAAIAASPTVAGTVPKARRLNSAFRISCCGVSVWPLDAHTPIAPPFGLRSSASARLSVYRSWK